MGVTVHCHLGAQAKTHSNGTACVQGMSKMMMQLTSKTIPDEIQPVSEEKVE